MWYSVALTLFMYWQTPWMDYDKNFLDKIVSKKTKSGEHLLSVIENVNTKAYFLFLKYV